VISLHKKQEGLRQVHAPAGHEGERTLGFPRFPFPRKGEKEMRHEGGRRREHGGASLDIVSMGPAAGKIRGVVHLT